MTSTEPDAPTIAEERRSRWMRRVGLGAFAAVVVAGLFGLLGVRTTTTGAADGPLSASLHHADIARPALGVPYELRIEREGGFDGPVEVRISTGYLSAFDENGRSPEPDAATSDGDDTVWTYDPPDGDVFTVWLDTRVEPGVQWRLEGRTVVRTGDDEVVIEHPMWILP